MKKIVKLAGQDVLFQEPTYKSLKRIITLMNEIQNLGKTGETMSEKGMDYMCEIIALMSEKSLNEVESMRMSVFEVTSALAVVPEICGIVGKEVGEATA